MKLEIIKGLPIASFYISYQEKTIFLSNVLFDTGCASSVFDTDILASIGIHIDFINGQAKRMYGIGGTSETCYEQVVKNIHIDNYMMSEFHLQLGEIQEPYGFDGILGIDFMLQSGLKIDFETIQITYSLEKST